MREEWIVFVAALAGMLAGGAMTFRYAIRAAQASGERSLQAQLVSAEQRLKMRLEAEAQRRRHEKLEESYGKLLGWGGAGGSPQARLAPRPYLRRHR